MLASPQNSCWNLTSNVVIVRGGTFGKWLGHDGRTLINGINVLIKEGFSNDSGKESACQCKRERQHGFDLWVRRAPGGGNGNPIQYSCLGNSMDGGAWRAAVYGVAQSWTRLSNFTFTFRKGMDLLSSRKRTSMKWSFEIYEFQSAYLQFLLFLL